MTNPTNTIKIPNDSIITEFKEHLDLEFNQRILFTAPFGAGKSTFIDDFKTAHKDEYRFIRLYPVNYAVSANEDIFELIKFDILYELMAHHNKEIALVKEDFDFWLRMSMFMQNKADLMPLFLFVLSQQEKIGKSAAVFIGAVEKILTPLKKGFKEYSEQIKIDELADITKFLSSFKDKKGNPYEKDATSQ
ncbi:MAG: P-loop NTPase fold protein, partial [Flavobacterium sp.]